MYTWHLFFLTCKIIWKRLSSTLSLLNGDKNFNDKTFTLHIKHLQQYTTAIHFMVQKIKIWFLTVHIYTYTFSSMPSCKVHEYKNIVMNVLIFYSYNIKQWLWLQNFSLRRNIYLNGSSTNSTHAFLCYYITHTFYIIIKKWGKNDKKIRLGYKIGTLYAVTKLKETFIKYSWCKWSDCILLVLLFLSV